MKQRILIVRGLPGSGKSTFAENTRLLNDVVVEADQFHMINGEYCYHGELASDAHNWCQSQVPYFLNQGKSVFVANTFITNQSIIPYYEIAKRFEVDFEIRTCEGDFGSVHNVPQEVLDSMKSIFQDVSTESFIKYYTESYDDTYFFE